MRIGIDVRCLAEGKRTGVEEYAISLLEELFRQDQKNEYILFFNAWKSGLPDFRWLDGFPNVRLKKFRFPNKLLNLTLWYFGYPKLDRLVGGTDIFFVPNLNFVAVSGKTKLVVTAHDLSFEIFPETFSRYTRIWHFLINFRRLLRRADAVIAVSQSTRDDLVRYYGLTPKKITTIHNGLSPRFVTMSRNDPQLLAVKEKYRLPYQFILYLGTFEPRKNILALLRAYETLVETNPRAGKYALVLAGSPGWKSAPLFEAIQASPARKNIHLPGFIADVDKPALYNLASLFVYPSLYEGFGFPPLESLASGTPVVVSHSSSLPEVIGEAGIMVDPYRPDELRLALEALMTDRALREKIASRAALQAQKFSWRKCARSTLALFHILS